jgi:hypothetical protein
MSRRSAADHLRTLGQVFAVVLLLAFFGLLLHKGSKDLAALLEAHPGDFWSALGRHILRILGGG